MKTITRKIISGISTMTMLFSCLAIPVVTASAETEIMHGDIDFNQKINENDFELLLNYLYHDASLTNQQEQSADCNHDGMIDEKDFAWLYLRHSGWRDESNTADALFYYDMTQYALKYPVTLYGDMDSNGKVNFTDYYALIILLNDENDITPGVPIQGGINLDLNADNVLDENDAIILLKYLNGAIDTLDPKATPEPEALKIGDADGNGDIDILDVITINKAILGKETLSEAQLKAIDFNGNGKPDPNEALTLLKYIVKIITTLS